MNISGKTSIVVNGKITRVCGRTFNRALREEPDLFVQLPSGEVLVPSKGLTWSNVASAIRAGKQVQAAARAVKNAK